MKIKKILSGTVAGALALSTVASLALVSSSAEEAVKTWTSDASTKTSAWYSACANDKYAVIPSEVGYEASKVDGIKFTIKYAGDNANGSFGGSTKGDDGTYGWGQVEWDLELGLDTEDEDGGYAKALGDGVYSFEFTNIVEEWFDGKSIDDAASEVSWAVNGYNRSGSAKNWKETTFELLSLTLLDAEGNVIWQVGAVEEDSSSEEDSSAGDEDSLYSFDVQASPAEGGSVAFSEPDNVVTDVVEGTQIIDVSNLSDSWQTEQSGKLAKIMLKGGEADLPVFDNATAIEMMNQFMTLKVTVSGVDNSKLCTSGSVVVNGTQTAWEQHEWNINNPDTCPAEEEAGEGITITEITKNQYTIEYSNVDGTPLFSKEDPSDTNTFFSIALQNYGWSSGDAKFQKVDLVIDGVALYDADGNVLWQDGYIAESVDSDAEVLYAPGYEFVCTAEANEGYTFVNWTDAEGNVVSEDAQFTYVLGEADTVLTANFVLTTEDPTDDPEDPTDDSSNPADDSSKDDNNGSTTNSGNSTTNNGSSTSATNKSGSTSTSSTGSDKSANTGASALAFVGLALAGSAIVVSKKKK